MNTQFNTSTSPLMLGLNLSGLNQSNSFSGQNSTNGSIQKTIELLENELAKGLPGFTPLAQLNAADFSSQAVADHILGFVELSINQRAGSELEAQSMLQQAREGIAQGFAEAREILSALPQMTDEINMQINETEDLIFKGLDNLYSAPIDMQKQHKPGQLMSESASLSSQFKQSNQATIEIVTRDGDQVEVSYSAFMQAASNQSYSQNQQGFSASSEFSSASSVSFEFSVQGEIDADEQQAINELLNEVGDLAQQFFNGDVQAAFNAAMELGFDSRELKSFALDFRQSSSMEVVQTYQRTEQINQGVVPQDMKPEHLAKSGPGPAVSVLAQLENLLEQAKANANANALLAQPEQTIKSVLMDMMSLLGQDMELPVNQYINETIEKV
jgi:Domain of unknown function (DUF5610)